VTKKINFTCPNCGGKKVDEVCDIDGTSTQTLKGIIDVGDYEYYERSRSIDGDFYFSRFECHDCHYVITEEEDELQQALAILNRGV